MRQKPRRVWPKLSLAVLVVAVGALQWFIWNPKQEVPAHVDAIFVLAYGPDRMKLGRDLARQGVSENLVLSRSNWVREAVSSKESAQLPAGEWFERCGVDYGDYRTFCVDPKPNSTGGEALGFTQLARRQGWESVLVVTERSHLRRAEIDMKQCFGGSVYGVASAGDPRPVVKVWRSLYETFAYAKDLAFPAC